MFLLSTPSIPQEGKLMELIEYFHLEEMIMFFIILIYPVISTTVTTNCLNLNIFENNSNESSCNFKLDFTANEILESIENDVKFFEMKAKEFESYDKMIKLISKPPETFSSDEDYGEGESDKESDSEDYHSKTNNYKNLRDSNKELEEIQKNFKVKPPMSLFKQKLQEITSEIDEQLEFITSQSNCTNSSDIYKSKINEKDEEIFMLKQKLIEKEEECEKEKSKNLVKDKQLNDLHVIIKSGQNSYQDLINRSQK